MLRRWDSPSGCTQNRFLGEPLHSALPSDHPHGGVGAESAVAPIMVWHRYPRVSPVALWRQWGHLAPPGGQTVCRATGAVGGPD